MDNDNINNEKCSTCGAKLPSIGNCDRCKKTVCENCLDKANSPWKSKNPKYYHKREYCPATDRGKNSK